MTDNRDGIPGSDGIGSGGAAPPPFPGAAPPVPVAPPAPAAPPAPYPPAPYPAAPARGAPWGWIVAAILAVALIALVCLYFFTSLLDKAPRDSWDSDGSSFSQSGSGSGSSALGSSGSTGSGQGSYQAPPPPPTTTNPVAGYAPTVGWLQGTWGRACPGSSERALTLEPGGRLVAQAGEGSWSLDGNVVTLTANGQTLVTRWEYLSQDAARVTQVANGQIETVRRCL